MLAKTFRQMLVILERNVRDQRMLWAALWQGFRVPPFAADDIIRQARRYKSKRELTRAIRLVARADLALRSNPPGKRLVLEKLVLDLAAEPKPNPPEDGCRKNCRFEKTSLAFRGRYSLAQSICVREVGIQLDTSVQLLLRQSSLAALGIRHSEMVVEQFVLRIFLHSFFE